MVRSVSIGTNRQGGAGRRGSLLMDKAALVVSLDFELYWGVRDLGTLAERKESLLKVRSAISRILEMFEQHQIHATWATVGFLFCRDREELQASLPRIEPRY